MTGSNARRVFELAVEAIGAGIDQVAHEIMPDIREKLVEEAWFGKNLSHPSQERDAPALWPADPGTTIDREAALPLSLDLDFDR